MTPEQAQQRLIELGYKKKESPSISKTIGQGIAGIPAGIASIADLPAAALNLGLYGAEKIGNVLGSDYKTPTIPYYAHDLVSGLTNEIVGKPQNNQEEIARTVGNIGGAFINPSTLIGKLGKEASGITSADKLSAFKDAGITPTVGEISTSKPVMGTQELLKKAPGSAGVYEKALNRRNKELDELFNKHGQLEKALPKSEAGSIVRKGAKAYNEKAKEVSGKLYDKAWKGIDPKDRIPLSNTVKVIDEELSAITPAAREVLQNSTGGKALIKLENAIKQNNGALPFADIKNVFKQDLADIINTFGQVGKSEQGRLKRVLGALDEEMKSFVTAKNPKAARDFQRADKVWAGYRARNSKIANKASIQENPIQSFNESFSSLKSGDVDKAKVLIGRLPKEDKSILSATYINELGRGVNGEFNSDKWAREFVKLRPESQKVITSGLELASAKKLNSIAEALQFSKISKGEANHSGTAYTGLLLGTGAGLLHSPIKTGATLASAYGLSKLFTNPKAIDALYAVSKAKTPSQLDKVLNHFKKVLPSIAAIENEKQNSKDSAAQKLKELGFRPK